MPSDLRSESVRPVAGLHTAVLPELQGYLRGNEPSAALSEDTPEHVQAALDMALQRTGAVRGSLEWRGQLAEAQAPLPPNGGRLSAEPRVTAAVLSLPAPVVSLRENGPHPSWRLANGSRPDARPTLSKGFMELFRVRYREEEQGLLTLWFRDLESQLLARKSGAALGRDLALRLMRPEIRRRIQLTLGLDGLLHGSSEALLRLEDAIEKVSATPYTLVIHAGLGSPDIEVAAAIHCSGPRSMQPFSVFHCPLTSLEAFRDSLDQAWSRASCGSLLLSRVDLLNVEAQRHLLWRLRVARDSHDETRVLVSTTTCLGDLQREGRFCQMLRAELDLLHLKVPSLRERASDIRCLLQQFLLRHGHDRPRQLSPQAWQLCLQHDWPENEGELERVAIRIAIMADGHLVEPAELREIAGWAPLSELAYTALEEGPHTAEPAPDIVLDEEEEPLDTADSGTVSQRQLVQRLVRQLVAQDFSELEHLGTGMQRALRFLATHFQEEITLGQLARESYISMSHLSFLFKRDLGQPFKTILAAVRIEKARQLLLANRQQSITEVCLDSGFGDLSHFERTFKRLIGTSPRQFRRQATQETAPGGPPTLRAC